MDSGERLEITPGIRDISIPVVNISGQTDRHCLVAEGTRAEWNGHPSTVLMPDGRTIFCVWQGRRDRSRQHGAPVGYMKRSDDELQSIVSVRFELNELRPATSRS